MCCCNSQFNHLSGFTDEGCVSLQLLAVLAELPRPESHHGRERVGLADYAVTPKTYVQASLKARAEETGILADQCTTSSLHTLPSRSSYNSGALNSRYSQLPAPHLMRVSLDPFMEKKKGCSHLPKA